MKAEFLHAELEITTSCDMSCFACDRFLHVSQTPPMSLGQIRFFIQESIALEYPWKRFHILGGEPTLHPEFKEVIQYLLAYKQSHNPDILLRVISNGAGKLRQYHDWLLGEGIEVNVEGKSRKQNPPPWFRNIHLAPIDEENYADQKDFLPCSIFGGEACGIGVTRHGMYLCGAGAGVARISGLPIGIMHVQDLTLENLLTQAKQICRVCGHWESGNRPHAHIKVSGTTYSPYWQKVIEKHPQNPPMPLYGESQ